MKYGLTLLVVFAIALYWYVSQEAPKKENVGEVNGTNKMAAEKVVEPVIKKTDITANSIDAQSDIVPIKPSMSALPEGQFFHSDPLVDAFIGLYRYSSCHSVMGKQARFQQVRSGLNENQKKHLNLNMRQCEQNQELMKQYSQDRVMYQLSQMEKNKSMRDKYAAMFSQDTLGESEKTDIKQRISQLVGLELLVSTMLYKKYFHLEILPTVQKELQAHNLKMVDYVVQQAFILIACERGVDCSATSPMMYSRCLKNENACGVDFTSYINKHYTPGIRNEILISKRLLQSIFSFS